MSLNLWVDYFSSISYTMQLHTCSCTCAALMRRFCQWGNYVTREDNSLATITCNPRNPCVVLSSCVRQEISQLWIHDCSEAITVNAHITSMTLWCEFALINANAIKHTILFAWRSSIFIFCAQTPCNWASLSLLPLTVRHSTPTCFLFILLNCPYTWGFRQWRNG